MKAVIIILSLAVIASFSTTSTAGDKHQPLPPQIIKATTVYIDNQSGVAKLGDRCYTEIEKWSRFKVVQDPKTADLVFLLSAKEYTRGYVTSGGGSTSTVYTSGNIYATTIGNQTTGTVNTSGTVSTTTQPTYTRAVTVGYTYLTVIDPKTGESLWSDMKRWGNLFTGFHSATKGLIDDLMKRINESLPATPASAGPASVAPHQMIVSTTPAESNPPKTTPQLHTAVLSNAERPTTLATAEANSSGTVSITSNPDGAEIFVDSIGRGHTPALLKVKPGKHTVQLALSGYMDFVPAKSGLLGSVSSSAFGQQPELSPTGDKTGDIPPSAIEEQVLELSANASTVVA